MRPKIKNRILFNIDSWSIVCGTLSRLYPFPLSNLDARFSLSVRSWLFWRWSRAWSSLISFGWCCFSPLCRFARHTFRFSSTSFHLSLYTDMDEHQSVRQKENKRKERNKEPQAQSILLIGVITFTMALKLEIASVQLLSSSARRCSLGELRLLGHQPVCVWFLRKSLKPLLLGGSGRLCLTAKPTECVAIFFWSQSSAADFWPTKSWHVITFNQNFICSKIKFDYLFYTCYIIFIDPLLSNTCIDSSSLFFY